MAEVRTRKRRRSLFSNNSQGQDPTTLAIVETYTQECELIFNELEELQQKKPTEQRGLNQVTLSDEKQNFLSSLPDLHNYVETVAHFLNKFSIYKEEIDLIKARVKALQSKLIL